MKNFKNPVVVMYLNAIIGFDVGWVTSFYYFT